jgi:protein-tyrosine phosphatase
MDESLKQLKLMAAGGVTQVFLTSHYFRGHYHYTRDEYLSKFNELQQEARNQLIPIELIPGFEVFLQTGIEEDIVQHQLTLGDSSYVLIESELNGLPSDFYDNVYKILRKGYKPILAHAERYVSIMTKSSEAKDLVDRNMYIQVNAGSLTGLYGDKVQRTAWRLVDSGLAHFIGSDDHVRGPYDAFFQARNMISERIDNVTAELLFKTHSNAIMNNAKIPYRYVMVQKQHRKSNHKKGFFSKIFG